MEKDFEVKEEFFCQVGLIKKEDGWYRFYCDGEKNYRFERVEDDKEQN